MKQQYIKETNNNQIAINIKNETNNNLATQTSKKEGREYYQCYSPLQNDYLLNEGFMYINEYVNPKTNKKYWLYKITNALSRELTIWSNNKPKNR